MSRRRTVCDYAGEELHVGDLINFSCRVGNRVRAADAVILKVTAELTHGRLRPMLLIEPTGVESGFTPRRSMRTEWISTEHVRLLAPAEKRNP